MARRVVAAVVASLVLTTCSGPANKAIGIRLVTRRGIEIQFLECAGPVISVQLTRVAGELAGDGDDRVLWQVTARSPRAITIARPGTTPHGFREVDPFTAELLPGGHYAVTIWSRGGFNYFNGFSLEDLRQDRIRNGWGELLTEQAFLAQAGEVCGLPVQRPSLDEDMISPVFALMLIPLVGLVCLGLVAAVMALLARRAARARSDGSEDRPG